MRAPQRILVPTDFSERSFEGIRYAGLLARPAGASLVLMSTATGPERHAFDRYVAAEQMAIEDGIRLQLEVQAERLVPDLDVTTVVDFHDDAAAGVLEVAAAEAVDLIVIASHGRSGMSRWLLGSVAAKVVSGADVPVVVVPVRSSESSERHRAEPGN